MLVAVALIIAALLVVIDQLIKIIVDFKIGLNQEIVVFDGIFSWNKIHNEGAAWGALEGKRVFLIVVAAVAIAVIIYLMCKGKIKGVCYNAATVMFLAGGLGNLIDRVFRGYVIDYLQVTFIDFPVFNFADCLITIGAGFLVFKLLMEIWEEIKAERAKKRAALDGAADDDGSEPEA